MDRQTVMIFFVVLIVLGIIGTLIAAVVIIRRRKKEIKDELDTCKTEKTQAQEATSTMAATQAALAQCQQDYGTCDAALKECNDNSGGETSNSPADPATDAVQESEAAAEGAQSEQVEGEGEGEGEGLTTEGPIETFKEAQRQREIFKIWAQPPKTWQVSSWNFDYLSQSKPDPTYWCTPPKQLNTTCYDRAISSQMSRFQWGAR